MRRNIVNYYTKDWVDYINRKWNKYVNTIGFFSIYDASDIEKYDGRFDDKLIDEFKKYYDAKKKYVEMSSNLEKKFGDYEKIKIKSHEEEF